MAGEATAASYPAVISRQKADAVAIRPLFRLAVRQDVFCETLCRFALNIRESRHSHASLLHFLNDRILIGHLLAQYHCRARFGFVAFCAVCAEYIFSRGI